MVLVDGELVWFSERGGRSLLNFSADPEAQRAAAGALAGLVGAGGWAASSSRSSTVCRCWRPRRTATGGPPPMR